MITVSIVSHHHGNMVVDLINQLNQLPLVKQIILTLNIPEYLHIDKNNSKLKIINNKFPLGFGQNHNNAFLYCEQSFFCVLNPDICFQEDPFPELLKVLQDDHVALVAPLILSPQGLIEDSSRVFPGIMNILKKIIFGNKSSWPLVSEQILYKPDWVAGMFLLLSTSKFKGVGGFDPKFFMYYEDVDLCRRIRKNGDEIAFLTSVSVTHNARRDSRKNPRFFLWHLKSFVRYLFSVN